MHQTPLVAVLEQQSVSVCVTVTGHRLNSASVRGRRTVGSTLTHLRRSNSDMFEFFGDDSGRQSGLWVLGSDENACRHQMGHRTW